MEHRAQLTGVGPRPFSAPHQTSSRCKHLLTTSLTWPYPDTQHISLALCLTLDLTFLVTSQIQHLAPTSYPGAVLVSRHTFTGCSDFRFPQGALHAAALYPACFSSTASSAPAPWLTHSLSPICLLLQTTSSTEAETFFSLPIPSLGWLPRVSFQSTLAEGRKALSVLTDQQLGKVGGLNVVIIDHRGDGSHERHPSWHVQVEVAGFCHPGVGEEREKNLREDVDVASTQYSSTDLVLVAQHTVGPQVTMASLHMLVVLVALYPKLPVLLQRA